MHAYEAINTSEKLPRRFKLRWNGECGVLGSKVTVTRSSREYSLSFVELWPHVSWEGEKGPDGESIFLRQSAQKYCIVDANGERFYHIRDAVRYAICGVASGGDPGTWYAMSDRWLYDFGSHKRVRRKPQNEPLDAKFPDLVNAYLKCIHASTRALSANKTMKCGKMEVERFSANRTDNRRKERYAMRNQ